MIYLQLAVLAAVFALGWGSGWKSQEATIQALKAGIAQANSEAALQLQVAQTKVEKADGAALDLKTQLEASHAAYVSTVNSVRDSVSDRLRVYTDCKDRRYPVPKTTSAGVSTSGGVAIPDVSASVAGVVADADRILEYAKSCQTFVKANCGIVP